jgi:glycosyltransferase involved in cell wall biosynthesis
MRVIFFSPVCPWPPDEGGKMRIMGLLGELVKYHEVTLLTVVHKAGDREGVERLREKGYRVQAAHVPTGRWRKLWRIFVSYLSFTPYVAVTYRRRDLRRALKDLARDQDVAHAEYPYGAQLISELTCLKVMGTQNVEADVLLGNARRSSNPLKKLHHLLQSRFMRVFELRTAARMDAVLACSDADRKFFLSANARTHTVPNAVESVHEREFPAGRDVVFTGLMSYLANSEGIRWFCREVWPLVKARAPDARLWIVGKEPGSEVVDLAGPDVIVTGRVEDVSGYYRRARVFVCPLRVGSGTRFKILEAFSWGVAVVSTALGCSGLDTEAGEHLLVAESAADFAAAVLAVLKDESLARRLGQSGRELVSRRFTWEATVKILNEKVYQPCA